MKERARRRRAGHVIQAMLLSALLIVLTLCAVGCQPNLRGNLWESETEQGNKLKVVTTLFPYYDFLRQIAGDRIELTLVLPAGMDSHSFEPTPADMITIQNADILVSNGGAMEQWLSRVLDSFNSGDRQPGHVIAMMDYVEIAEEEIIEGMEAEAHAHDDHDHDEHGHDHDEYVHDEHEQEEADEAEHEAEHEADHEIEIEYDEHIWTSPVNAIKLVKVLTKELCVADPDNAIFYEKNGAEYEKKLSVLDEELRSIVRYGKTKLIVFGDKFPLRYFFDEYGLEYRAAFTGCSTDTEPSAKTIAYLIDKVRTEQLQAVYYLELSSHRVADIIGEETKAEPLLFHTCHNVTRREFDSGVTYLKLMEQNAINLRKGLN